MVFFFFSSILFLIYYYYFTLIRENAGIYVDGACRAGGRGRVCVQVYEILCTTYTQRPRKVVLHCFDTTLTSRDSSTVPQYKYVYNNNIVLYSRTRMTAMRKCSSNAIQTARLIREENSKNRRCYLCTTGRAL